MLPTPLELRVMEQASRFDIIALLQLLRHMGYRPEELVFKSHVSLSSQPGIVQAIEFRRLPAKQVAITVNFGLLGPLSPLPSYFLKAMEESDMDEDALVEFIAFFDHSVIGSYLKSIYPEDDPAIFRDWEQTKARYRSLVGLRSPSTLHWVFEGVFPELRVSIGRDRFKRDVKLDGVRLGHTRLGDPVALGGTSKVPVMGFDVALACEEEYTTAGRPWAEEARRRLKSIVFPVLRETDLDLRVRLVVQSQKAWAQLTSGSYLGFDRIRGGRDQNRIIIVHDGPVPRQE